MAEGAVLQAPGRQPSAIVDAVVELDGALSQDHSFSGLSSKGTAGEDLAQFAICYLKSDGKYWKADADAVATMPGVAMAAAAIAAGATGSFIMPLSFVRDDSWNWTVGASIYASGTAGGLTQTAPSGGSIAQVVGWAYTADIMFWSPVVNPILVNPTISGPLIIPQVGGHAIGGAADSKYALLIRGTWAGGGSTCYGLGVTHSFSPSDTISAFSLAISQTVVKAGTGKTHPFAAGLWISDKTISGLGTITNSIGLDITEQLGGTSNYAIRAAGTLALVNGTAPGASPANMVQLYAADVETSSELFCRDEAGNAVQLTPHPTDFLDTLGIDSPYPWAYFAQNNYLGKKVKVDMALVIAEVERLGGRKLLFVEDVAPRDWDADQEANRVAREEEITEKQNLRKDLADKIAVEVNPLKVEEMQKLLEVTKVPQPLVKIPPPKWMRDRGVKSIL